MKLKKFFTVSATALMLSGFGAGFTTLINQPVTVARADKFNVYYIKKAIKFTKTVKGKKVVGVAADIVYANFSKFDKEHNGNLAGKHVNSNNSGAYKNMGFYTASKFQFFVNESKKQGGGPTYNIKQMLSNAKEGQTIIKEKDAIVFYQ